MNKTIYQTLDKVWNVIYTPKFPHPSRLVAKVADHFYDKHQASIKELKL